jgi:hypothetical protein
LRVQDAEAEGASLILLAGSFRTATFHAPTIEAFKTRRTSRVVDALKSGPCVWKTKRFVTPEPRSTISVL